MTVLAVTLLLCLLFSLVTSHIHPHAPSRHGTKRKALVEEKAHLEDDLEERFSKEAVENMTAEERDYHYFRLHDFDQNNMLDGLEVLKAISHDEHEQIDGNEDMTSTNKFDVIVEMIDKVSSFLKPSSFIIHA